MRSAISLITAGMIVLTLSLGTFALTRPSQKTGNAGAFELALAGSTDLYTESAPSPLAELPPGQPGDARTGAAVPSLPRFTISQSLDLQSRVPVSIQIPALGQEADIIPAGVEPNGDMEVPDNVSDVAWYRHGAAPGEPGSAVLAAHVDLAGQGPGVFFDLRDLEPGSVIYITFDDGATEAYMAEARTIYNKQELPTEAIFSREGPPVLTLITCGGDFNRSIRSYDSNVVVYAVPWDVTPPATS
jgi:sortase (surface protein transpeptidase)